MQNLYDCEFVSERYNVEIRTVWSWIREKKLPAIKIGKQYRIREEDLKKFEEERKTIKK
jgi:excisionase family DNA binding protein|nr:helix-turn-helix domain-containing protein [uncultured Anaerocolumna sp.]